jgi:hypothetical protein
MLAYRIVMNRSKLVRVESYAVDQNTCLVYRSQPIKVSFQSCTVVL